MIGIDYPFVDPVSGREVVLRVGVDRAGVKHGACPQLADVSPGLDAFYCTYCSWNGRVSGAWVMDLLRETDQ